jgi:phage tail-like protein
VTNSASETVDPPYTAFRFEVELTLQRPAPGVTSPVCKGAFAECDGLEMTMEPKTFREGGNNQEQHHLIGPISYSQLTLKRGMTDNLDLWNWFAAAGQPGRTSIANGRVTISDPSGRPRVTFTLSNCLPVKMRGPSLNAKDGQIAIEEMQLVYSRMTVRPAGAASAGLSFNAGFSVGASADLTAGLSAEASASFNAGVSASASVSGGPGLSGDVSASASFSASATAGLDIG